MITIPQRYRHTDGQTDKQTDNLPWHAALRVVSRGNKVMQLHAYKLNCVGPIESGSANETIGLNRANCTFRHIHGIRYHANIW